jgi:hypothetical protein
MQDFKKILNGWQNFLTKSEVTELMAEERAKICFDCKDKKKTKLLAFIKDDLKEIEGFKCKKCKCPLSAKIRSIKEKCPKNLW